MSKISKEKAAKALRALLVKVDGPDFVSRDFFDADADEPMSEAGEIIDALWEGIERIAGKLEGGS